jgi:hypothetical protein
VMKAKLVKKKKSTLWTNWWLPWKPSLQNPKFRNHPSTRMLFDSLTSPFSVTAPFLVTSQFSTWRIYWCWMWWETLLKYSAQNDWMFGRFATAYQILERSAWVMQRRQSKMGSDYFFLRLADTVSLHCWMLNWSISQNQLKITTKRYTSLCRELNEIH